MAKVLGRSFYERDTRIVAFELLGKLLYFRTAQAVFSGIIVETEAYLGSEDPASHAYRGPTPRNQVMFEVAGFSYVYFTYGFHHCFNVTTERSGIPGAVLIRALEPKEGIETMRRNRGGISEITQLANGPGKLTQALGINRTHSALDLAGSDFCIQDIGCDDTLWVGVSPRIGIKNGKNYWYRYFLENSPFASRAPKEIESKEFTAI